MKRIFNNPEFLYHYTSIETLALILKNKKIRFNQMSNTDDLEESMTGDAGRFGKYIFVSCWTASDEDNIPMWHMYSEKLTGVRIKLPTLPFKNYLREYYDLGKDNSITFEDAKKSSKYPKFFIPPYEFLEGELGISPEFQFDDFELKVYYTNDEEKINPKILKYDDESLSINTGSIGKYKRECWKFQDEYRYRIVVQPENMNKMIGKDMHILLNNSINGMIKNVDLPISYYDLVIDEDDFRKMEIMKGPGMTSGQSEIVDTLVGKYNPGIVVTNSILKNKIRSK